MTHAHHRNHAYGDTHGNIPTTLLGNYIYSNMHSRVYEIFAQEAAIDELTTSTITTDSLVTNTINGSAYPPTSSVSTKFVYQEGGGTDTAPVFNNMVTLFNHITPLQAQGLSVEIILDASLAPIQWNTPGTYDCFRVFITGDQTYFDGTPEGGTSIALAPGVILENLSGGKAIKFLMDLLPATTYLRWNRDQLTGFMTGLVRPSNAAAPGPFMHVTNNANLGMGFIQGSHLAASLPAPFAYFQIDDGSVVNIWAEGGQVEDVFSGNALATLNVGCTASGNTPATLTSLITYTPSMASWAARVVYRNDQVPLLVPTPAYPFAHVSEVIESFKSKMYQYHEQYLLNNGGAPPTMIAVGGLPNIYPIMSTIPGWTVGLTQGFNPIPMIPLTIESMDMGSSSGNGVFKVSVSIADSFGLAGQVGYGVTVNGILVNPHNTMIHQTNVPPTMHNVSFSTLVTLNAGDAIDIVAFGYTALDFGPLDIYEARVNVTKVW